MRRALLAVVLLVMRPGPAPVTAAPAESPGCGEQVLVQRSGQVVLRLGRTFIHEGSDSVRTRTRAWVRGRDYLLDPLRGDLRLLQEPVPGETLWVRACALLSPPALEVVRQRYRPAGEPMPADVDSAAPPSPRAATFREPTLAPLGTQLAVSGNKTVAVEFGSQQDAALRQSLDLSVSGAIAPGVSLSGVLTDRDTPLSAQGATQDLQSIDRVLLSLQAPRARADLGDIPVALARGEFARLERRVQGVRGLWEGTALRAEAAAASAQGEYHRLELRGTDGLQGPYLLTDRDGRLGVTVVAGSERVTLDGERLTRGEAADYAVDYERARLTFSPRRPIGAASRITIEYQYAVTRFRRDLALAAVGWRHGAWDLAVSAVTERDDAGRPLDLVFSADDRTALALAGDSLALGAGVTPGGGDYDTVRVHPDTLVFAFAGRDSGAFRVAFARLGAGRGDYADSALVDGVAVYRWVGPGRGTHRVGRELPRPESQQLAALAGATRWRGLLLEFEGAMSRRDLNTLSGRDDADVLGAAGRVRASVEGRVAGLPGRAGLAVAGRRVEPAFATLSRLEPAFAEEDLGLPAGTDLERPTRWDAEGHWQPAAGRALRGGLTRLATPAGYLGWRRRIEWSDTRAMAVRVRALDAEGALGDTLAGLGRRRFEGEWRWTRGWVVPVVRGEWDRRRTALTRGTGEDRASEWAGELQSGARSRWRLALGWSQRREAALRDGSRMGTRAGAWQVAAESPAGGPLGVDVALRRRVVRAELGGARQAADLARLRLRAESRATGLTAGFDSEVSGEAENRRTRVLTFVGPGRGSYDAFGNFVGSGAGDHDLALVVSPEFERLTRVASSVRSGWRFGASDAWRGSRVEFAVECDARRRGSLRVADGVLSTGVARDDARLARASVAQRLEGELAPGSRAAAWRLRLERRVTADRASEGFAQVSDLRDGSVRWRARPGAAWSLEAEGRTSWQQATQASVLGGRFARTLREDAAQLLAVWQRDARLRAAWAADLALSRPVGQPEATRTLRLGPDLGLALGARGRADLSLRRAFLAGPAAVGLLPSAEPAGAARWDATARADLRLHTTTVIGVSSTVRERPGRAAVVTGRAEVRAFF